VKSPPLLRDFQSGVGKSRCWTFPRSGFFHGPFAHKYCYTAGIYYEIESDIDRVIGEVDVVYQTRIRPERVADVRRLKQYAIDSAVLRRMKPDAVILHPLPRTVELDKNCRQ